MYHTSSQKEHWMFSHHHQLTRLRTETNTNYCRKYSDAAISEGCQFLTPSEEQLLRFYYMKKLLEFCNLFESPVPRGVVGTAAAYFKRFYLFSSVMDYHPKDIFMCCVYMAFKIEEYNVSVDEFVHVLVSDLREPVAETVISNELLMLKKLKFHLIVHTPFRPLEGFFIDLKTRTSITNVDSLRKECEKFLNKSLYSDVGLLYPPSQIALASIHYAAKSIDIDFTRYIQMLLCNGNMEKTAKFIHVLENIADMIQSVIIPDSSQISHIEERLRLFTSLSSSNKRKKDSSGGYHNNPKRIKVEEWEESMMISGFDVIQ